MTNDACPVNSTGARNPVAVEAARNTRGAQGAAVRNYRSRRSFFSDVRSLPPQWPGRGAHFFGTAGGGTVLKKPEHPFRFVTVSYLTRIGNQSALTISELRDGLEKCSDASIFHHTFESLERHHFLTYAFSNDFAQWVLAGLNCPLLAEQLAAPEVRGYLTLSEMRTDLLRITDEYCRLRPEEAGRSAFEPFHFCESVEVTIPSWEAWTLEEFRHLLERKRQSNDMVDRVGVCGG